MKNILGLIGTIILFGVICYLGYQLHMDYNKSFINITPNELVTKVEKNDTFILYVTSSDLEEDIKFTPLFKRIVEQNNIESYYIDIKDLNTDDLTKVMNVLSFDRTPTVGFIVNGKESNIVNRIVGYDDDEATKTVINNKLREMGYLK